jgi:hypothetical protein
MKLKTYLNDIFDENEIKNINNLWLERNVDLEIINNIYDFIQICEHESSTFKKAGPHRLEDWENGWSGNGITDEFKDFPNIPYYFKKNTHLRLKDKVYKDLSGLTELCVLRSLQDLAFSNEFFDKVGSIIEYGCGTGHNLTYLKTKKNLEFYGADWAQSAVDKLIENNIVKKNNAFRVDYFKPETYKSPSEDFVAFTNASLEQSGSNYKDFMNYLFKNNSCIGGIHIEPISDLVKPEHPLNINSISYTNKRGYLNNFYNFMLESGVNIKLAKDYGIGSKYLSGYQLIIWSK